MKWSDRVTRSQWGVVMLIIALTVASLLYRVLHDQELQQTSALFIGLPATIAIILTLRPKAKSMMGMIMRGITIALLASIVVLHEGIICIVMAAPLFYLVGIIIGAVMKQRRTRLGDDHKLMSVVLIVPLLLMSLEGTHERLSFSRAEEVTVSRVVDASPAAVEAALSDVPQFNNEELPFFLGLGFPTPVSTSGSGLQVGNQRVIGFTAGNHAPGELRFEVTAREQNGFRMTVLSDSSKISEWLKWREAEVHWQEVGENQTLVTWQLRYDRLLDPAWYFGPAERYAVGLTADYLIEMLATP